MKILTVFKCTKIKITPVSLHQTSQHNFYLTNVPEACWRRKLILPVYASSNQVQCYCHYIILGLIMPLTDKRCFKLTLFQCLKNMFSKASSCCILVLHLWLCMNQKHLIRIVCFFKEINYIKVCTEIIHWFCTSYC